MIIFLECDEGDSWNFVYYLHGSLRGLILFYEKLIRGIVRILSVFYITIIFHTIYNFQNC